MDRFPRGQKRHFHKLGQLFVSIQPEKQLAREQQSVTRWEKAWPSRWGAALGWVVGLLWAVRQAQLDS